MSDVILDEKDSNRFEIILLEMAPIPSLTAGHKTSLCFIVKCIPRECALEASSFLITLCTQNWTRIGFQTICDVKSQACWPRLLK